MMYADTPNGSGVSREEGGHRIAISHTFDIAIRVLLGPVGKGHRRPGRTDVFDIHSTGGRRQCPGAGRRRVAHGGWRGRRCKAAAFKKIGRLTLACLAPQAGIIVRLDHVDAMDPA